MSFLPDSVILDCKPLKYYREDRHGTLMWMLEATGAAYTKFGDRDITRTVNITLLDVNFLMNEYTH